MEENRWFKGTGQITIDIEKVIVGDRLSQREPSKLGTKLVKLYLGDKGKHDCLKNWTEVFDIESELQKDEWKPSDKPN
jgi:hypothetical protein